MVACYLFAKKHKLNFLHCLDITVLGGALGFFFGRIANFINGELYGRAVSSKISWAVKFPSELREWASYDSEKLDRLGQVVESLGAIPIQGKALNQLQANASLWSEWVSTYKTSSTSNWNVNQFLDYIYVQVYSGNVSVSDALQSVLTPRHPSQLYQAFLEGFMVFLVLNIIWLKPRKPGVIAAWFGALYGVARVLGEQYRMPDASIGYQLLGLTRGQWLSVGLIIAAIMLLMYSLKKDSKLYGGWLK